MLEGAAGRHSIQLQLPEMVELVAVVLEENFLQQELMLQDMVVEAAEEVPPGVLEVRV
jgi:hypothetical protein